MTGTGRADTYLGREELLDRLADLVEAAADGRAAFVVLRGPAGSGATATAEVLAARAASRGFSVSQGAFADGLHDRPYGALAAALESHAATISPDRLAAELGGGAPALARMVPALRARLAGIAPAAPLEPFDERLRLFDAYTAWLRRAASDQPLALVLDDLQWADADAVAMLDHVLRRTTNTRLLVVATWSDHRAARGVEIGARPAAAPVLDRARVHVLGGIDKGATGALLSAFADHPLSSAAVDLIQQATGGQPLPALELYRHLREEGHLGEPGRDALPAADDLPRRLDEIVAWRVAALAPEARSAVLALACFPDGAPAAQVAAVAELARARLVQALDEARERGFVEVGDATGARYRITHAAVRRALLGLLEPSLLAAASRRAADALEADSEDLRAIAPLLADLHSRAPAEKRSPAAVRHALVAAEQARAATAYSRAAAILARAVSPAEPRDSTSRAELDRRLLEAHAEAGDGAAALSAAETLLQPKLAGRGIAGDVAPVVDAARRLRSWGDSDAVARLVALGGRPIGGNAAGRKSLAQARLELLAEHWEAGDSAGPLAVWSQVDAATERLLLADGDEVDRADLFAPQRRRTHEQTVALLTMSREWRRPASLMAALRGACTDLTTRSGRFREAAAWAGQYLVAAERYGSPADVCRALLFISRCRAVLGELDAATDALDTAGEQLAELAGELEMAEEVTLARLTLAHYRDGDWRGLVATVAGVMEVPRLTGLALGAELAVAHARLGDEAAARAQVELVIDHVERWPPLTYLRDGALLSGLTAAWEIGWAVHLVRSRALISHAAADGAGGNHAATPGLALARLHALAGALDEARAAFANERDSLDEAGLRPLRAIADHDEGIAIAAAERDPRGAVELLRKAAAQFADLGMSGWLERTERLIEGGFEPALRPGGRLHLTYPMGLARREVEVVRLLAGGLSLAAAATMLELDLDTAQRHLASAMAKLGTGDAADLPRLARRHGLGGT